MTFTELKSILATKRLFRDPGSWRVTRVRCGGTSPNKFRMRRGRKDLYVKEINEQEKKILPVLTIVAPRLIPPVVFPDLIDRYVLVSPHLGACVRPGQRLSLRLFRNIAEMHNRLNDPGTRRMLKKRFGYGWSDRDNGFYSRDIVGNIEYCCRRLAKLNRKYGWSVIGDWMRAFKRMRMEGKALTREVSGMPFARHHNDFREDNIVGSPQRLADWGSSYGHAPFLCDVGAHMARDARVRAAFVETSNICRKADAATIDRWLWVATCTRSIGKVMYGLSTGNERMRGPKAEIRQHLAQNAWMCRIVMAGAGGRKRT